MARTRLIPILVLLAAAAVPAAGSPVAVGTGIIPLRLTDAEPSYLGVRLWPLCSTALCRPTQDARLPVTNDGSNLSIWGSSVPLRVLAARDTGALTEVRVVPFGFNLAGPRAWADSYGGFHYVVQLSSRAVQPQSLLYFASDAQGAPTFAGTLYVAAVLRMTDLASGAVHEQELSLALSVDGKWVDEPAVTLLDGALSSILPFTGRDDRGLPTGLYTCARETHPLGYYCLETSPDLLSDVGRH